MAVITIQLKCEIAAPLLTAMSARGAAAAAAVLALIAAAAAVPSAVISTNLTRRVVRLNRPRVAYRRVATSTGGLLRSGFGGLFSSASPSDAGCGWFRPNRLWHRSLPALDGASWTKNSLFMATSAASRTSTRTCTSACRPNGSPSSPTPARPSSLCLAWAAPAAGRTPTPGLTPRNLRRAKQSCVVQHSAATTFTTRRAAASAERCTRTGRG
jgi:hypothetical protein